MIFLQLYDATLGMGQLCLDPTKSGGQEVHMLDIECFTYLDVLLESPMVQMLVLVTNCRQVLVRGMVDIILPHGIAVDLDRYLLYFDFVTVVDAT